MAGLQGFASHGGSFFYLGTGWPQWKPLGIPGTHLPLKRGSWLTYALFSITLWMTVIYRIKVKGHSR